MKFNCGSTWEEKIEAENEAKKKWHRWFAWHPVRVGSRDCRWLETVERKGRYVSVYEFGEWYWEYRPLSDPKIDISDNGVLSVDSNEVVRSKAGQEQIEALERMTNKESE